MTRRVVVTGLGVVSPVGNNVEDSWNAVKRGQSGVGLISRFDTTNYAVKVAAEVKNFDPTDYVEKRMLRRLDPHQYYMIAAAQEALRDSGLEITEANANRSSVVVASSSGGLKRYQEYIDLLRETGDPRKMSPYSIPMLVVNSGNNIIALMTGARGPSQIIVSACASGADNIGHAYTLIRASRIDRALAGCADYPIFDLGIAAFDRMGALSRNPDPHTAIRPFDRDRSGFVFGEGCGVIVLEELETAKLRGARILAELIGYGSSTDAFHRVAPLPGGEGAAYAIKLALDDAQINPEDVKFVNAHGTSTLLNDPMETNALKLAFSDHAYKLAISATKSVTGHAMGTTAALEAVFTVLSIRDQVAPPTLNLDNPDPECDLDYVPHIGREMNIDVAMSNSFGFGGHNTSLIFKRFND